jgi:hypothetical protein
LGGFVQLRKEPLLFNFFFGNPAPAGPNAAGACTNQPVPGSATASAAAASDLLRRRIG